MRYCVRAVTDPNLPNNEGCYRMIKLTIPERCLLNPQRPAPVNNRAPTLRRVDLTLHRLDIRQPE